MSEIISSNQDDEYVLLAEVPNKYYRNPQLKTKNMKWHVQFNVAAWLRLSKPCPEPLALVVTYQDSTTIKEAFVEFHEGRDQSLLLSGTATLLAVGPIDDMTIELKGVPADIDVKIDELYIERVQKKEEVLEEPMKYSLRA